MLKSYLLLTFRQLWRQKRLTIINIGGLAIGLACCFWILLYVQDEYSYDTFNEKMDQIYRVVYNPNTKGSDEIAKIPPAVGPQLTTFFPEIEQAARIYDRSVSVSLPQAEQTVAFEENKILLVDSTLFSIFTFDFIQGDSKTALRDPFSVVLTEPMAQKYFGSSNPIGQTLQFRGNHLFRVTAVVAPFPPNAHFHFNMLLPYDNMYDLEAETVGTMMRERLPENWTATHSATYVLLGSNQFPTAVDEKFPAFLSQFGEERFRDKQTLRLEPLQDIRLKSDVRGSLEPVSSLSYIYLLLAIAILTLLIACFNFINLSTALSLQRKKEVGVRKVLGAGKERIVGQFLSESVMLCVVAFVIAMGLVVVFLPTLNQLAGKTLTFHPFSNWPIVLQFFAIAVATGLLAGLYPAFFAGKFEAINLLQPKQKGKEGTLLRKVLISAQFAGSISLIIGTSVIFKQLDYLRNQSLGFDKDYMLTVRLFSDNFNNNFGSITGEFRAKMNKFEEQLLQNPRIDAVTASSHLPGVNIIHRNVYNSAGERLGMQAIAVLAVDYDFFETYGLEVISGREFDSSYGTDHEKAFVINEKALEFFELDAPADAIGQYVDRQGKEGQIVGVVKDFSYQDLRSSIGPCILEVNPGLFTAFSIKVQADHLPETIAFVQSLWKKTFPEKVFEYAFLNDELDALYRSESRLTQIIGYFAGLALLLSLIGLLGLVAYLTQLRTKEISIRKILGASIGQLWYLLTKEFTALVIIAGLMAIPLSYWGLQQWLNNYAYKITISWWLLLFPILGVLAGALLILSVQVIKSARSNPVKYLRQE